MADNIRKLLVFSVFESADHGGELQSADLFDHQHIQHSVCRIGLRHRMESAAVELTVAGADQRFIAIKGLPVDLHHIMLGNAPDHIDHRGGGIGPETAEQRDALIVGNIGADAGIQAHRADIQTVVIVAPHQVKDFLLTIE